MTTRLANDPVQRQPSPAISAAADGPLRELLGLIEQRIDLDHCRVVDQRYRAALSWQACDRPPVVVQPPFGQTLALPAPFDRFAHYGYREAYADPAKMLQNMLLSRIVPGLLLKDDSPLAIRADHGTVQIATLLGGSSEAIGDDYPWVRPLGSIEAIEELADRDSAKLDLRKGVLELTLRTMRFYRDALTSHPKCFQAIQVSLPDLQGPIDTAEQLWGSSLFEAGVYDRPDLLDGLLRLVVNTMLQAIEHLRPLSVDRLAPLATAQHGYCIPGNLLIRDDTSIMFSAPMYEQIIRPHDARLLEAVGGGSIHFCGNGLHLVGRMLQIPHLRGLDFGEADQMDFASIYSMCRERRVALTNFIASRHNVRQAMRRYPTGVVFVCEATNLSEAFEAIHG